MKLWYTVEQLARREKEHSDTSSNSGKATLSFTGDIFKMEEVYLVIWLKVILKSGGGVDLKHTMQSIKGHVHTMGVQKQMQPLLTPTFCSC